MPPAAYPTPFTALDWLHRGRLGAIPSTGTTGIRSDIVQDSLVFMDAAHQRRWLDAIGADVVKYIEDFVGAPVDPASGEYDPQYTITRVEAGAGESTFGPADGQGGWGKIATDLNENDGVNAQLRMEAFKLVAGDPLYFGTRIKLGVAAVINSDFFFGLAITDTDILGGVTDRIGFEKLDDVTDITAVLEKDSIETLTASLATATSNWTILEFFWDGAASVEFFIDGVSVATPSIVNLPNDEELRVSLQFLAGTAGGVALNIDWIRVIQLGRAA